MPAVGAAGLGFIAVGDDFDLRESRDGRQIDILANGRAEDARERDVLFWRKRLLAKKDHAVIDQITAPISGL